MIKNQTSLQKNNEKNIKYKIGNWKLEIIKRKLIKYLIYIFAFFLAFFSSITPAFALVPNDAGYSFQWYLEKINAPKAWDITTGKSNITIAFIDSGIDINHPDLKKNIWVNIDEIGGDNIDNDRNGFVDDIHGWNFVENNADVNPKFEEKCLNKEGAVKENCQLGINHGTIIAGIASAIGNNKQGIAGISWNSKIMPLKTLDGTGYGKNDDVIKAVNYAINNGADIINLSLMGESYSKNLEEALQKAYEKGIIIVAAAGNKEGGGTDTDKYPRYPVCYSGKNGENIILGVAGTDRDDGLSIFSNFGKNCIDIAAPAEEFYSTSVYYPQYVGFEGYYNGLWSGTSLATPIISGLVALVKSARPALNNKKIYDLIINNSDKINSQYINAGRVNLLKTLQLNFNDSKISETRIIVSPQKNKEAEIRQFRSDGIYITSFLSYKEDYLNGVSLSSGDVDGDGISDILTAKSYGGAPEITIFDYNGNLKSQFFAYDAKFKGGVNITTDDIDGDGIEEIITGAGLGGGPHVRIFDIKGNVKSQFFAYSQNFQGGVKVASGDIDGDGIKEIITGAGKGGRAHIRIFDIFGNVKSQFFAYNENFLGGVNVVCDDTDGDGIDEVITAPLSNGGPHIRIFDNTGNIKGQFFSFEKEFYGGVNLATNDIDNDGKNEIIIGKGYGSYPEVKIFDITGKEKSGFYAFDKGVSGGVIVGTITISK